MAASQPIFSRYPTPKKLKIKKDPIFLDFERHFLYFARNLLENAQFNPKIAENSLNLPNFSQKTAYFAHFKRFFPKIRDLIQNSVILREV